MIAIAITPLDQLAILMGDPLNNIATCLDIKTACFSDCNTPNILPCFFAAGGHHRQDYISCLKSFDSLLSDGVASGKAEFIQLGSLVHAAPHASDGERWSPPVDHGINLADTNRIQRVSLGNAKLASVEFCPATGGRLNRESCLF